MKKFAKASHFCLPLLLLILLGACSRYIEGGVYLDKNSNNTKDLGEPAIAGIQYSVTGNGSAVNSGVTDADGKFLIRIDGNEQDVNYCVSVDSAAGLVFPNQAPAGKSLEVSTEENEDEDKNDVDESETEEDEDEEEAKETPDPDACPKDADDKPKCGDSRCDGEAACITATVKSLQACDKTKLSQWNMELNVPVAVDYASRIAKIEKTNQTVKVGDTVGLEIVFPKSCTFKPFTLPKSLQVSLGNAYDPITREVFLSKAVAERPSQLFYNDTPRFGHDELITYLLPVQVVGGGASGDEEIQLQPKLVCPDGKEVLSNLQVLLIQSSSSPGSEAYDLSSELTGSCPELGESGVLISEIEHTVGTGMAESAYALTISGGANYVTLEDLPEFCHQVGPTVECDIAASDSLTKLALSFNFTISESIPKPATVSFTSKLEVQGSVFNEAPVSCTYE